MHFYHLLTLRSHLLQLNLRLRQFGPYLIQLRVRLKRNWNLGYLGICVVRKKLVEATLLLASSELATAQSVSSSHPRRDIHITGGNRAHPERA